MKIERLSTLPKNHDAVQVFASLSTGRRAKQIHDPAAPEKPQLPRIEKGHHDKAAALIPAAVEWLETNRSLICSPGDFRITGTTPPRHTAPALPSPFTLTGASISLRHTPLLTLGFRLPISPVIGLTRMTAGDESLNGWRLKAGILLAPGAGVPLKPDRPFVAEVVAGFQQVPHLIHLAIALICHHWLHHPEDHAAGSLGHAKHAVDQRLCLYLPKAGGPQWL